MLARVVISTLLIVLGIASPWLVKDWMDWRADEARADRLYDQVSNFSDRVKKRITEEEVPEPVPSEPVVEQVLDQEPYPLASKTMRMLKGMLPGTAAVQGTATHPFAGLPPSTSSIKEITSRVEPGLEVELGKLGLAVGNPIFVRVFKEENELEVWMRNPAEPGFTLFKIYRILDWSGSLGPKLKEGDGQSPEGFYFVSKSGLRPETRHHLGIDLGFPNEYDQSQGRSGSAIMIHGGDRSAGSFVLSPGDVEEVFTLGAKALEDGQKYFRVNSFPFRMTDQRMEKEWKRQPRWIDFWVNLKEGYDFFENVNLPPDAGVSGGNYVFRLY